MANPRVIESGTREYKNLRAVAKMLEALSPNGVEYEVGETYFDFGQDWIWTTILAYEKDSVFGGYQAINPRDWESVIMAENENDFAKVVSVIRNNKFFNDK